MKYFLTGATGFIGGRIARQLREQGHEVVALVRSESKAADLAKLGITLHVGDVTEKSSMHGAMDDVDGVFHTAGWYKLDAKDKSVGKRVNVHGTRNVLELMRDADVPRGVYTSTLAVYSDTHGQMVDESYFFDGRHLTEYDRTKWLAHYEVALPMIREGLPLTIVLPGVVYGPGDRSPVHETFQQYLRRELPMIPSGTDFCWSHVDDVAKGHCQAMTDGRGGESYILAGERHSLVDALQIAEQITGIAPPKFTVPGRALRLVAMMSQIIGAVVPMPAGFGCERLRSIAGTSYLGDNTKARRELRFDPRSLSEGLRETLEFEMRQTPT